MSFTLNGQAVTSAATFTIPDDLPSNIKDYVGIEKYAYHTVDVDGAGGSAVITADQGSGVYKTVATLTADSATYLLPNTVGLKIQASGGNITFGYKASNSPNGTL